MSKYVIEDTTLTAIADAIRTKLNSTSELTPAAMPEKIAQIDTYAPVVFCYIPNAKVYFFNLSGTSVTKTVPENGNIYFRPLGGIVCVVYNDSVTYKISSIPEVMVNDLTPGVLLLKVLGVGTCAISVSST